MKNGYFFPVLILLFPVSGFGQGFADIPSSAPAPEAVSDSFNQPVPISMPAVKAPPAAVPAAVAPVTAASAVSSAVKSTPSPKPAAQDSRMRPELLRSKVAADHPFARFMELPKDPQSPIKGSPLSVAQLLHGTYSPVVRKQLLESYWELLGLLAEYNIRRESEQLAASVRDAQQAQTLNLFRQQRRSTEMKFVKKQWEFAELLKRSKGVSITENTLPLPCDYPVYKPYETYSDKIARSEQAKYLAHLLPIQQQLVDAQHKSCEAVFHLSAAVPSGSLQLIALLNQRTETFLELTQAVVEYNQMIAQYTAETVGPNVNQYQLVGAVIELPKFSPRSPAPDDRRSGTTASPAVPRLSSLPLPAGNEELPMELSAELPAEKTATTFDKTELPKRTFAAQHNFPEAEPASPAEQIAADFSLPSKPAVQAAANVPESSAEFPMFSEGGLSQDLPQPPRIQRPIRQASHTEKQ